jgi:hypothetical protein
VDEDICAVAQPCHGDRVADVAAQLLDRALELRVVEGRHVERPHVVTFPEEPPGEVEAEEARAARDRPPHRRRDY